MTFASPYL